MKKVKIIGLILLITLLAIISLTVDFSDLRDKEQIQQNLNDNFIQGTIVYIIIFTGLKLLFVPLTPTSILAGYLFGWGGGAIISLSIMVISSIIMYYISKHLGKEWVKSVLEDKFSQVHKYNSKLKKHGFLWTIFLRIVPIMNHNALNILFGISRIKDRDFILGTVIGAAPGIIILAGIGDNLDNPSMLIIMTGVFLAFIGTTTYIKYKQS